MVVVVRGEHGLAGQELAEDGAHRLFWRERRKEGREERQEEGISIPGWTRKSQFYLYRRIFASIPLIFPLPPSLPPYPDIDRLGVVAGVEQNLGCAVPAGDDVLAQQILGLLRGSSVSGRKVAFLVLSGRKE